MRNELEQMDMLSRYIMNDLDAVEREKFERELKANTSLQEELEEQRILIGGLERMVLIMEISSAAQTYLIKLWLKYILAGAITIAAVTTTYYIYKRAAAHTAITGNSEAAPLKNDALTIIENSVKTEIPVGNDIVKSSEQVPDVRKHEPTNADTTNDLNGFEAKTYKPINTVQPVMRKTSVTGIPDYISSTYNPGVDQSYTRKQVLIEKDVDTNNRFLSRIAEKIMKKKRDRKKDPHWISRIIQLKTTVGDKWKKPLKDGDVNHIGVTASTAEIRARKAVEGGKQAQAANMPPIPKSAAGKRKGFNYDKTYGGHKVSRVKGR